VTGDSAVKPPQCSRITAAVCCRVAAIHLFLNGNIRRGCRVVPMLLARFVSHVGMRELYDFTVHLGHWP